MLTKWLVAKDQISVLILKDFKLKYNSTALGVFWSFGVPVAQSLVYFFAFSIIMRLKVDNYLLYQPYLLFIIPVLFVRIRNRKLSPEEFILLLALLIHTIAVIGQIAIADKELSIYKRYLILASPLSFGWAAIGMRWLYDRVRKFLKLKYRSIAKASITGFIIFFIFNAWSRVRKARINPFFYKTLKQYTGVNPQL